MKSHDHHRVCKHWWPGYLFSICSNNKENIKAPHYCSGFPTQRASHVECVHVMMWSWSIWITCHGSFSLCCKNYGFTVWVSWTFSALIKKLHKQDIYIYVMLDSRLKGKFWHHYSYSVIIVHFSIKSFHIFVCVEPLVGLKLRVRILEFCMDPLVTYISPKLTVLDPWKFENHSLTLWKTIISHYKWPVLSKCYHTHAWILIIYQI